MYMRPVRCTMSHRAPLFQVSIPTSRLFSSVVLVTAFVYYSKDCVTGVLPLFFHKSIPPSALIITLQTF
jgi:hypothetical protein